MRLAAADLRWKGEGGANIVLAADARARARADDSPEGVAVSAALGGNNPAHPILVKLRKRHPPPPSPPGAGDAAEGTDKAHTDHLLAVHRTIHALFPEYLDPLTPIPVSPLFLTAVCDRILTARPEHRRHKRVDTAQPHVFLTRDYTLFDGVDNVIAVEIKPKSAIAFDDATCRFCALQALKHADGNVDEKSAYCPALLFSRDKTEIEAALWAMVQGSRVIGGKSAYFRLFCGGSEVGSVVEDDDTWEIMQTRLAQFFGTATRDMTRHATFISQQFASLIAAVADILAHDDILPRLAKHQAEFSRDISTVLAAYDNARAGGADVDAEIDFETPRSADHRVVRDYLLAMCLRDCSIIFCMSSTSVPGARERNGVWYDAKLIDIDWKKSGKVREEADKWDRMRCVEQRSPCAARNREWVRQLEQKRAGFQQVE